jgi:pentatricopeptide repeat protein
MEALALLPKLSNPVNQKKLSPLKSNRKQLICSSALALKQQERTKPLNSQCHQANDIPTLCRNGKLTEALGILHAMDRQNIQVESSTYASLLQACGDIKALAEGRQVHTHILKNVINQNVFLETNVVTMYGKCESIAEARLVFDGISNPNVFSWNAIIRGYAAQANNEEVLALYYQMRRVGILPDSFTFVNVLKACTSLGNLEQGKEVHEDVVRCGLDSDVYVGNALATMYAKRGNLEDARDVFDKMSQKDVVSWNGIIAGYVNNRLFGDAAGLVRRMGMEGMKPNSTTMVGFLPACVQLESLRLGKEVHGV